jgi:hypothetical protein
LERTTQEQLRKVVGEAAKARKDRVPQNGNLEHPHAPKSVAKYAGEPTAKG